MCILKIENVTMKLVALSCIIMFCIGCINGGSHGSIKTYEYPVSKSRLEKAIQDVVVKHSKISVIKRDSLSENDRAYISIMINNGETVNSYTFRFGGNTTYWDTSRRSSIFLAYAFDKYGNGGSIGDGGLSWYKFRLRNKLISLYENEFIAQLDSKLGIKHLEE